MIDVTNQQAYNAALVELKKYKQSVGRVHKGRFIQIFLALKFHQNNLPSMFSGSFVATDVLQTLIDDLYSKASRAANDSVLILFEGHYLARTGLVGIGNNTTQNTWRNNFNLQKGAGCYAPPNMLASQVFLDQDRSNCQYLIAQNTNSISGATCSLCQSSATYRSEQHRKWLRIDPNGNGYATVDLLNTMNFSPYVAPNGSKIPAIPLAIALYFDSNPGLVTGNRKSIDMSDFMSDFNFSPAEFLSYFDDSYTNQYNQSILAAFPGFSYNQISIGARIGHPAVPPAGQPSRPVTPISQPVLSGTPVTPPAVNTGWDAEQCVADALAAANWKTYDVSRQRLGYDILATKGRQTRFIEVKSSLGNCTPSLTSREWQQAKYHGSSYVLAVIENFNSANSNTVYWIPDPNNRCRANPSTTISYSISRSDWSLATQQLSAI